MSKERHIEKKWEVIMSIHLSRLLKCFVVAVVLVLCTSSSFLGYAQQPEISVGETVKVVTDGTRLNLRKKPGLTGEIVAKLENGETMRVIEGPRSADGYKWWKLEGEAGTGWAASQFLQVAEPATSKASGPKESPMVTANDSAKGAKNIFLKFHEIAPNAKVIGFTEDVDNEYASKWSKQFWHYAIKGEEFGIAANRAAYDTNIRGLVVEGNRNVYLHSLKKKWVDLYGFTGCPDWPLRAPSVLLIPCRFVFEDPVSTWRDVEHSSQKLIDAGYVPRLHLDKPADDAITTLRTAEVLFFHGHGEPDGINFHDNDCGYSFLSIEKLEKKLPPELPDLKLVVLLACSTAPPKRREMTPLEKILLVLKKALCAPKLLWEERKKFLADLWEEQEKKLADLREEQEKKVADWQEEQKEKAKEKAKEELQRQLFGAPAGLVIISSYQFWRWRKRSKRPS
jgi:hypothetical protein